MSSFPSPLLLNESGPSVRYSASCQTAIRGIELSIEWNAAPSSPTSGVEMQHVVWGFVGPRREQCFADSVYSTRTPVVLTRVSNQRGGDDRSNTTVVSIPYRVELMAGSRFALLLADIDAPIDSVRETLERRSRRGRGGPGSDHSHNGTAESTTASTASAVTINAVKSVQWRISGHSFGEPMLRDTVEWQPLLHFRWYELKSSLLESTVVEQQQRPHHHCQHPLHSCGCSGTTAAASGAASLCAGGVKEAVAIGTNRAAIQWSDGSVGSLAEVRPYRRSFTPARPAKVVRVRRFPHRHADIVGEVSFGTIAEAMGRTTDPFTGEHYVLLRLPMGELYRPLIALYDLVYAREDYYIWGWSKVAGTSGQPLLEEVAMDDMDGAATALAVEKEEAAKTKSEGVVPTIWAAGRPLSSSQQEEVVPLPPGSFYTPVGDRSQAVRIRRRPTLTSPVIREMPRNEAREATSLIYTSLPIVSGGAKKGRTASRVMHCFVEWARGGYSLMQNHVDLFLAPVNLMGTPRRFPLRTRSRPPPEDGDDDDAEEESVIDLTEERRRRGRGERRRSRSQASSVSDDDLERVLHPPSTSFLAADASLLSPHSISPHLREGLAKGRVRLEDLPRRDEHDSTSSSDSDEW